MTGVILLALLGVGLLVGLVSGLLGIGGGVLIVPFLYFFYGHPGWSGAEIPLRLQVPVAHATSLFIILPTALRGVLSYQRSGLVVWGAVIPIAIAATLAAILGALLAPVVPGEVLETGFALLLLASAARMVVRTGVGTERRFRRMTLPRTALTGLLVGSLSAMLGVGGGVVALPLLMYLIGLRVDELAATSLAIVMFSALAGTVTYLLTSPSGTAMPMGTIGYVHVLAALPILAGSLLSVGWGTRLNRVLPNRVLTWIFASLFTLVGLEIIVENLLDWF